MHDPSKFSPRGQAAGVLAEVGGAEVFDDLVKFLDEQKPNSRTDLSAIEGAIRGLGVLGPSAKAALPRLVKWAESKLDSRLQPYVVRRCARLAIRRVRGLKLGEE